jgi:hypothetical protein
MKVVYVIEILLYLITAGEERYFADQVATMIVQGISKGAFHPRVRTVTIKAMTCG